MPESSHFVYDLPTGGMGSSAAGQFSPKQPLNHAVAAT
jgi:hypothetical protein